MHHPVVEVSSSQFWHSEELNTLGVDYRTGTYSEKIFIENQKREGSKYTFTENKLREELEYGTRYDYETSKEEEGEFNGIRRGYSVSKYGF